MGQISQMRLARELGISRDCIFDYMNPEYPERAMQVETLKKLAVYFKKDIHYFCNAYHIFLDTVDGRAYLKDKRSKLGMSQREYAKEIGVTLCAYKVYERGRARIPEEVWKRIAF